MLIEILFLIIKKLRHNFYYECSFKEEIGNVGSTLIKEVITQ